jgi:biopolymer transport protein TolR
MAMSAGRPGRGAIADINVTPMADVMIVLLIIFLVATPVIVGAPVRLPAALHAVDQRAERLEVVVRVSGAVSAGGLAFSGADTLAEWISARRASGAETVVLLQADRGVAYGEVAHVLSACRRAGVGEVALAADRRVHPQDPP